MNGNNFSFDVNIKKNNDSDKDTKNFEKEKINELSILISGIAHEINNPNNFILLNSSLLFKIWEEIKHIVDNEYKKNKNLLVCRMSYPELEQSMDDILKGLYEGSTRINNIVKNLRDYICSDTVNWDEKTDVNETLKNVFLILNNLIKKNTSNILVHYEKDIPCITCNNKSFMESLINISINFFKALKSKNNTVTVKTEFDKKKSVIVISMTQDQPNCSDAPDQKKLFENNFCELEFIKKMNAAVAFNLKQNKGTEVCIEIPI